MLPQYAARLYRYIPSAIGGGATAELQVYPTSDVRTAFEAAIGGGIGEEGSALLRLISEDESAYLFEVPSEPHRVMKVPKSAVKFVVTNERPSTPPPSSP